MNSRGKIPIWQSLAGFGCADPNLFRDALMPCRVSLEAFPSRTRCASNCQNRYPSPSRRSDQNTLVGPTCHSGFRRSLAGFSPVLNDVIAYQVANGLLKVRSDKLHNIRGNTRCKRNSHSFSSPRFSDCRLVLRALTSSALRSAGLRAALLAMPSAKAAASKAASWALRLVPWRTTSTSKLYTGGSDPARNVTRQGYSGASRMALFAVRASHARTRSD